MRPPAEEVMGRVLDELGRYDDGVHELRDPAYLFDSELPESLAEVYRSFDGGELFHGALVLYPSASLRREDRSGSEARSRRFHVGEIESDDLFVDDRGRLWRRQQDAELELIEATGLDRWLSGHLDAEALLYERDGEFRDGAFTDTGEIEPAVEIRRERLRLKRDPKAPGPRFRLARLLLERGELEEARACFEEVVAEMPELARGWLHLARISEALGDLEAALEELRAGAEAADSDLEPLLWANAARVAAALGDESGRGELARKALAAAPALVDQLVRGAEGELEDGRREEAVHLVALARAIAPRNLAVIDIARRL
jgi:tetratricopeptide (TPR) repeat protein